MKRLLCALLCALPLLVGCEMNDSSSSAPTAKTTLYGYLQPPAVAPAMLGQSRRGVVRSGYNTPLLADFVSKGTCLVNGKGVSFSLDTGTSMFKVSGLEPHGAYEVRFDLASLTLRATKPYSGSQMNMGTVDLTSTAKALLYETFGAYNRVSDIQDYDILEEYYLPLATKLTEWVKADGMTPDVFKSNLDGELTTYRNTYRLTDISKFTGNDMSGTWTGAGTLYTPTPTGSVGHKASVNLTLKATREKNVLTGYLDVQIVSSTVENSGGGIPISGKRAFTATITTEGRFSFELYNSNQRRVETWNCALDETDALVCTVTSADICGFQSGSPIKLHQ